MEPVESSRIESSQVKSSQAKSSQVKSSQVKHSWRSQSTRLALVLRRLGERVRVGFGLVCSAIDKEGQVKSRDAAIAVVSRGVDQ